MKDTDMSHSPFPIRRRALIAGALSSAAVLASLAACSQGSGSDSASSAGTALPQGEGSTTYPLELTTPYGTTTLEARPQRIAVVDGFGSLESTLALGVSPVVTTTGAEVIAEISPWLEPYRSQVEGAAVINPFEDAFPFESVQAATPDLIVAAADTRLEPTYDRLAQIAPVLGSETDLSQQQTVTLEGWKTTIRLIGKALDLSAKAEEVITSVDEGVAAIATDNPDFAGKTVAVLINRGQDYGIELVNRADSVAEELLTQMGFAPHPKAQEFLTMGQGNEIGSVSLENIGLVDADILVVGRHGGGSDPAEAATWMESNELYTRLPAVQNGHTVYLNEDELQSMWAFSWPDALNIPWSTDTLATLIAQVLTSPSAAPSDASSAAAGQEPSQAPTS